MICGGDTLGLTIPLDAIASPMHWLIYCHCLQFNSLDSLSSCLFMIHSGVYQWVMPQSACPFHTHLFKKLRAEEDLRHLRKCFCVSFGILLRDYCCCGKIERGTMKIETLRVVLSEIFLFLVQIVPVLFLQYYNSMPPTSVLPPYSWITT